MIRETVEKWKKENGNLNVSQKDLVIYLVQKIDRMEDKLFTGQGKIGQNTGSIKGLKIAIGILATMIIGVIGWIIGYVKPI